MAATSYPTSIFEFPREFGQDINAPQETGDSNKSEEDKCSNP
jgi:hypothetical protein